MVLDDAVPGTEKGTSRGPIDGCIRGPKEPCVLDRGPAERACSARPWSFRCSMFRFTSYHAYVQRAMGRVAREEERACNLRNLLHDLDHLSTILPQRVNFIFFVQLSLYPTNSWISHNDHGSICGPFLTGMMRDTEFVNTALASTHCMKKSSISARSTAFRAVVALTALVSFCSFKSFRSRDRTRFLRASSRREEIPPPWCS